MLEAAVLLAADVSAVLADEIEVCFEDVFEDSDGGDTNDDDSRVRLNCIGGVEGGGS